MSESPRQPLRFLFTTLGHVESDFYGRVGAELERRGHVVGHLTSSRRAAQVLRRGGHPAWCSTDVTTEVLGEEPHAVAARYGLGELREVYRTDATYDERDAAGSGARAMAELRAAEQVFDAFSPDVVIPEVGNESIRSVAQLVAQRRGVPVLFLFYTIFPDPLRLYVDTMHAPIVAPEAVPELDTARRERIERFIAAFTARRTPIRAPRDASVTAHRLRMIARHVAVKAWWDRDNPYLRPVHLLRVRGRERVWRPLNRRYYGEVPSGPYVFFPLHVADDYKIKRLLPHLADQGEIVARVAAALPPGWQVVVKEHPMAIGRTAPKLMRRLSRTDRVVAVPPERNAHDLVEGAEAVVTISSTVGLEALLYGKPVITLGQPFYSGQGITLDAAFVDEVPALLQRVATFRPDRERTLRFLAAAMDQCLPGAPVLVDRSDANAIALAGSIERAGRSEAGRRRERVRGPQASVQA